MGNLPQLVDTCSAEGHVSSVLVHGVSLKYIQDVFLSRVHSCSSPDVLPCRILQHVRQADEASKL